MQTVDQRPQPALLVVIVVAVTDSLERRIEPIAAPQHLADQSGLRTQPQARPGQTRQARQILPRDLDHRVELLGADLLPGQKVRVVLVRQFCRVERGGRELLEQFQVRCNEPDQLAWRRGEQLFARLLREAQIHFERLTPLAGQLERNALFE